MLALYLLRTESLTWVRCSGSSGSLHFLPKCGSPIYTPTQKLPCIPLYSEERFLSHQEPVLQIRTCCSQTAGGTPESIFPGGPGPRHPGHPIWPCLDLWCLKQCLLVGVSIRELSCHLVGSRGVCHKCLLCVPRGNCFIRRVS